MKNIERRQFLQGLSAAATVPIFAGSAAAQTYPARPVRVVLPYAPAGITDVVGRLISLKLSEQLGKQFVVENVPGATGNIGTAQVAKAAPDGYTILVTFSSFVVNPTLFDKIPYDPYKDFVPISLAITSTTAVGVNPLVPAKSVKELVELIRANPGKYSYAHAGTGTQSHLAGEQFRLKLGLDLVPVPFNGGGPAAASVVGGHTPVTFNSPAAVLPFFRDGKLRVLAVNSEFAHRRHAGDSDHRGSRIPRHPGRQLGRRHGPRRHSQGDRRDLAWRDRQGAGVAGHEGKALGTGLRRSGQHAGGICRPHQDRNSVLGRRDPRCQDQDAIAVCGRGPFALPQSCNNSAASRLRPSRSVMTVATKTRLDVVPLTRHIGAEIRGIDLSHELDPDIIAQIHQAWLDHSVLVFRGQKFSQDDQIRITGYFGELAALTRPAKFRPPGYDRVHPNIMMISNIRENGETIGALPDGEMHFHHDQIHAEIPHGGTLLYSLEIPTHGGDTLFADGYAAYDTPRSGAEGEARRPPCAQLLQLRLDHARRHARRRRVEPGGPPDIPHP